MKSRLPNGWRKIKLGNVVDSISERLDKNLKEVVTINTSDVLDGEVLNHAFIPNKDLPGQFIKKFNKNDILFSEIRPINKRNAYVNFTPNNYIASSKLMVLRTNQNYLEPFYFFYYITSEQTLKYLQMLAEARSGTFPQIRYEEVKSLDFAMPPLVEQGYIIEYIKMLDKKIENNNKINENLEQQAQELFKHWFGDFEFPDKNGIPYKSSGGEMEESELGMIPKGWEVEKLKNIVNIKYGKNLPVKNLLSTGYNVFGGNGVIGHYDEYIYEEPEVLIACRGAASGKINISTPKSFVTNNSLVLESSTREVFEYVKGKFTHEDLEKYVTGSAQPQITITNIADVEIIKPDIEILKEYYNISNSFSSMILENQIQNQKLSELRDTLLPKLMSGELRIPLDK